MTQVICFNGIKLRIDGDYQAPEPRTSDYPGCPEWIEIDRVTAEPNEDISELFDLDELANKALEQMRGESRESRAEEIIQRQKDREEPSGW